jgi:hypothetical protein
MTPDQKLARSAGLLKGARTDVLVMGGHAVRYYGIDRNTIDFLNQALRAHRNLSQAGKAQPEKVGLRIGASITVPVSRCHAGAERRSLATVAPLRIRRAEATEIVAAHRIRGGASS